MSAITSIQTRGMLEAYQAVHSPELRAQLDEENKLVEQIGIDMIENAAYVLFSQGYDVDDVISYFTEATTNTIIKDYLNFSEGNLIIESVAVSGDYIEEQFELLYEKAGILTGAKAFIGSGINAVKNFASGAQKSAEVVKRAQNIKNIRADRLAQWKQGSLATPITPAASKTPNILQKASDFAKTQLGKLPGAQTAQKFAKSGAGKLLGKVGSRVIPGLGVAAYGMDAVDRAKKGDYGGAALSGIGAGLSAIPGVGLVAGLAPTAIQMATDAAGLTGDKSKKGSAKTLPPAPLKPPSLKNNQEYAKSKGKYFSSSDRKTYGNFNDAEAAKNSRTGVKPTPKPVAPGNTPTPGNTSTQGNTATPGNSQKEPAAKQPSPKSPTIGKTPGGTEYERRTPKLPELAAAQEKRAAGGSEEESIKAGVDAGKASNPVKMDIPGFALGGKFDVDKTGIKPPTEFTKTEKKKTSTETTSEGYDAYDLVLEYLLSQGHTDTIEEAHYVMMEMDEETIGSIIEQYIIE